MDKNEWYRVGEDIRDQVQQAVETGNFTDLGKNIGNRVNETLNHTVREMNRTLNSSPYAQMPQYRRPNVRPDTRLFQSIPKGTVSGVFCMGIGYGTMGIALLALIGSVGELILYSRPVFHVVVSALFAAAGFALGFYGTGLSGRAKRYKRYVNIVKDRLYCTVQELASRTGRKERFVVKDLKKMIQAGMFKQAHLDQQETCLIASDAMYEQYQITQKHYEEEQRRQAAMKQEENRKQQEKERLGEAGRVIEEGKDYVRLIRQCNDEIPGEEMSDKLDRLEILVSRIFDQVEKEPELAPELRKMLRFYLPTTKKLLEAYRDLDAQEIELSNVAQTKREIETAVDNINEAFEKFLDELFREKAWDIQSDISALHTILKQDGYL